MKTLITKLTGLALSLLLLSSFNDLTLGPEPANSPENNYDLLWQEFDRMYSLFESKKLDWKAVYEKYCSMVKTGMSEDTLFDVVSQSLGELNDGHLWLLKPGPNYRRFDCGPTYTGEDFSAEVTRK